MASPHADRNRPVPWMIVVFIFLFGLFCRCVIFTGTHSEGDELIYRALVEQLDGPLLASSTLAAGLFFTGWAGRPSAHLVAMNRYVRYVTLARSRPAISTIVSAGKNIR